MSNAVATVEATAVQTVQRRPVDIRPVSDPIAVLDTARFEHMQRIATIMARSNLIPHSLCCEKGDDNQQVLLPIETVTANCFLIVNQAVRWNMDPFAVAQCVSVVHGKLCYEGKLIAAVIQGRTGVDLEYEFSGQGEAMKVVVTGTMNGKPVVDSKGRPKSIEGTVAEWKTTNSGSPWAARGGSTRMLRYRGAREWCRVYEPGLMLGVYGDDELEDLRNTRAAALVDDGGGPPAPANDDGGGPPVPAETRHEIISHPDNGESEDRDRAQQAQEGPIDGGGPPVPTGDDLDIPDYLRRTDGQKPARSDDEQDWLNELETEFDACTSMEELSEANRGVMSPWEGSVPTETWNAAIEIMDRHVQRLQACG